MTSLYGFGHQMPLVNYMTDERAVFYRLTLDVLLEEEARLGVHLPTAEIQAEVAKRLDPAPDLLAGLPPVDGLLDRLRTWGNVDRIYNLRRSSTPQEFIRKDFLYQLTPAGAQVHRTLIAIDQELGAAGALQSTMLPEVLEALSVLVTAVESTPPDLAGASRAFGRLAGGFAQLTENAKLFVQGLNHSLAADDQLDVEAFLAYKDVVVEYLQTFILALSRNGPLISKYIDRAEAAGITGHLPSIAALDAAPQLGIAKEDVIARDAHHLQQQWAGVRGWFFEGPDRQPIARTLQDRASDAVNQILLTIRQLNEQRFRRVDRTADLVALAAWFDDIDNDDSGSDASVASLWRTAFGMYSTRHLGHARLLDADSDAQPETSWWDSPPAPISASYRAAGPRTRPGPVPRIRPTRHTKMLLAAELGKQQNLEATAEQALAARGPILLSKLGELDDAEADVLLRCLDCALSTPPDNAGGRRATTSDGRLTVVLRPAPHVPTASVAMRGGRIRIADMELTVRLHGGAA
ncbi:TIGR02677 family protein [Streptomyces endophyticus]|uniref:TIGR02677 family protein n=1 Tax=Streptomyces endophyticus TaxID=714166 RepID=A0ABU6FH74_9ACTN|nr:TIGR02677 family protein [Streptomyces endophyticus]MEB8343406.1 TIGR02677 family protein [Streptomyces endophyticus]